jgi:hypothetical protein
MNPEKDSSLILGKWIGRGQAFAMSANHSLLAQALCWKQIHDSGNYKATGLSWEDFCPAEIGLSRTQVEALIAGLEEFGETYCRLSEIVRVSAETYRALAPKIENEAIEIDGELVPIAAENAVRIRGAVHRMRSELRQAREKPPAKDPVARIQTRLEGCVAAVFGLSVKTLDSAQKDALRNAVEGSALRLMEISERLAA